MSIAAAVVPVIDLKGGIVVQAVRGDRENYAPLRTRLAARNEFGAIADGLLRLAPFPRLYIADLDAIMGKGDNLRAIVALARRYPALEIWVDAGSPDAGAVANLLAAAPNVVAVVGTESLSDVGALAAVTRRFPGRGVLSIDVKGGTVVGDPAILEHPEIWPNRVIAMTLDRVGAGQGPDLDRIRSLRAKTAAAAIYAAGGVRATADIAAVTSAGAKGVLVASALHAGTITAGDLVGGPGR